MRLTPFMRDGEQLTVKAYGDPAIDTVNLQKAFDTLKNVTLEPYGHFVIDAPIVVDTLWTDPHGRAFDFNNSVIECVDKESVPPTNAFIFVSTGYPNGIRNTKITGMPIFDGEVSGSFLRIEGGSIWHLTVEDITASYAAIADSLVEFCSNTPGANAGACTFRNFDSHTHIKYTLKFTVEDDGDTQFDDFIIEMIQNYYTDAQGGAAVYLDNYAKLVYSDFKRIINTGNGDGIGGSPGYLYYCDVNGIYMEPKGTNAYGVSVFWADGCTIDNIWIRADEAVTTTSRTVKAKMNYCTCNHHRKTKNDGTLLTSPCAEENAGSTFNIFNDVNVITFVSRPNLWIKNGCIGLNAIPEYPLTISTKSGEVTIGLFGNSDYISGTSGSSMLIDFGSASGNTYSRISALSAGGGAWNNLIFQSGGGKVGIGTLSPTSVLHAVGLPVYANNSDAVGGGLTPGAFYRTNGNPDTVCVVH